MNILYGAKSSLGAGVQQQTFSLIRELNRRGHNAFLITEPGSEFEERAWRNKTPILRNSEGRGVPLSPKKLAKAVSEEGIEVVHLIGSSLLKVFLKLKERFSSPPRLLLSQWVHIGGEEQKLFQLMNKGVIDQIVVPTRWLRNAFIASGFAPTSVSLVPPGVDLIRFDYKIPPYKFYEEFNLPPEMILIGCFNAIEDGKGHDVLIDAAPKVIEKVPETVFIIAGEGKRKEKIERRVAKEGLEEKFIFTGFREDLPHILSAINLLVMPATSGVSPSSVLEAMAMAKPVVATQLPGITEVVADGGSGILVPPGDADALSDAILSLVKRKNKLKSFGKRGRKIVEENFDMKLIAKEMERVYAKLVEEGK
ncbi:MAG: glycosyltransferase family 4 protein [Acidobacteria bacterium]|nr:glycosyltransferase family 4 protein [Acidobacteriota bacterium]